MVACTQHTESDDADHHVLPRPDTAWQLAGLEQSRSCCCGFSVDFDYWMDGFPLERVSLCGELIEHE